MLLEHIYRSSDVQDGCTRTSLFQSGYCEQDKWSASPIIRAELIKLDTLTRATVQTTHRKQTDSNQAVTLHSSWLSTAGGSKIWPRGQMWHLDIFMWPIIFLVNSSAEKTFLLIKQDFFFPFFFFFWLAWNVETLFQIILAWLSSFHIWLCAFFSLLLATFFNIWIS